MTRTHPRERRRYVNGGDERREALVKLEPVLKKLPKKTPKGGKKKSMKDRSGSMRGGGGDFLFELEDLKGRCLMGGGGESSEPSRSKSKYNKSHKGKEGSEGTAEKQAKRSSAGCVLL